MSHSPLQRRYLPSHAILRSFECAARHESFTKAAEELHLTQSAISRQVRELEEAIGVELFRRVGRRVVLTDAGISLAKELSTDLENIRRTLLNAMSSGDEGASLRVAVLPTFASRWLIPRLPEFHRLFPDITVNLATRLKPFDMTKERFDIAIHFGADDWPDTKMVRIFDEEMIAVCSPEFKAAHDIVDGSKLIDLSLLHLESRPDAWSRWFARLGIDDRRAYSGRQFDQFSMLIAGAMTSLGAALLPRYLVEEELLSSALLEVEGGGLLTNNSYYVVTEAGSNRQHVTSFCNWIRSLPKKKFRTSA